MALNPDDPAVRWAAFGRQVELFLEGDIGKYLVHRFTQQILEATEDLKKADAFSPQEIMRIQNRIHVGESILEALRDVIAAGHSALEELKNA